LLLEYGRMSQLKMTKRNHFSLSECNDNIFIRGEDIYILSDKANTYQQAKERCQSYEGQLVQISNQEERENFISHLRRKYLQGIR